MVQASNVTFKASERAIIAKNKAETLEESDNRKAMYGLGGVISANHAAVDISGDVHIYANKAYVRSVCTNLSSWVSKLSNSDHLAFVELGWSYDLILLLADSIAAS